MQMISTSVDRSVEKWISKMETYPVGVVVKHYSGWREETDLQHLGAYVVTTNAVQ